MKTLTLAEAAAFLHMHPMTLQKKARLGEIPGTKPGRRWVFVDVHLVEWMGVQSLSRMMQGEHEEKQSCHFTGARILPSGGSSSITTEERYKKALGLPTR